MDKLEQYLDQVCRGIGGGRALRQHLREELREHLRELRLANVDLKELSMGMTHDYLVAVEEGATIVRIGTALFGPRPV